VTNPSLESYVKRKNGDNMPKKETITPEDIISPPVPDELPSMSRKEIREARNKIQVNRTKRLHTIAERKIAFIKKIGEDYYINPETIRNTDELAKLIEQLDTAIRDGNTDQVKLKKNVLRAKTKMEEGLNKLDKERLKILDEFREEREKVNVVDRQWNNIKKAQRDRAHEGQRATASEVDALQKTFNTLKSEIAGYRLDRHMVARVENLQTEIQILKQQNQKIFQMMKSAGFGR